MLWLKSAQNPQHFLLRVTALALSDFMEDNFLKVAKEAAIEAGKVIQKYAGQAHQKNIKNGDISDFTTNADLESERIIVEILTKNFPGHSLIAEEGSGNKGDSENIWVVDPLDGSFSFSVGMPFYSVSIGLIRNGKPFIGVIYQPAMGNLFYAQTGKGSFLNDDRLQVSNCDLLEKAACVLDPGHSKKRPEKVKRYILPLINKIAQLYEIGSAASSLSLIARETFDAVINSAWLWDFAAGTVIVREAGGKVTDFEGREPDWTKERLDIVASNGLLHNQIIEALRK